MTKTVGKILIVDDNNEILIALKYFLEDYYEEIVCELNPNQIPYHLRNMSFDIIILDMNFKSGDSSGNEGLYWLDRIIENDKESIVIMITAYGDISLAVEAMKRGATDFIQKPWEDEKLLATLSSAYKLRKSRMEIKKLKETRKNFSGTITNNYTLVEGNSLSMKNLWLNVGKISTSDVNVLITGENGTGKELVALEIHQRSERREEAFVKIDISTLNEFLVESELFGHVKGAFTGANSDRLGRLEIASGGTLFIDEIGNIPLHLQAKLLAVLQNREFVRLGSNMHISLDIRLITATNADLPTMVKQGKFREDLLYRINTITLEVPPLRSRIKDIPELFDHFLRKYARKYQKGLPKVENEVYKYISNHSWPGNVRELEHFVEKTLLMNESDVLKPSDIQLNFKPSSTELSLNLEENEKIVIARALKINAGNISKASEDLGITRKTLYNKMEKYAL